MDAILGEVQVEIIRMGASYLEETAPLLGEYPLQLSDSEALASA